MDFLLVNYILPRLDLIELFNLNQFMDFALLQQNYFKMFLPEVFFIDFYFYSVSTRIFNCNFKTFKLSVSYAKFWKIIGFNFIFNFFIG